MSVQNGLAFGTFDNTEWASIVLTVLMNEAKSEAIARLVVIVSYCTY